MTRKFKLNTSQKTLEPTKEQIDRHKNFQQFRHDYERLTKRSTRPFYKDKKLFMLIVLIGIVLLLLFLEA